MTMMMFKAYSSFLYNFRELTGPPVGVSASCLVNWTVWLCVHVSFDVLGLDYFHDKPPFFLAYVTASQIW